MKKVFLTVLNVICLFFLISCEIGLGQEVDLVAPVLKVTSPSNNTFVPRNFNIEGTATDNVGVTSVHFEYSYIVEGKTIKGSKDCYVYGQYFSCPFSFDKDTEVTFQITAKDLGNNGSEYSSDTKTYIVDSKEPNVGKVSILRGTSYVARLLPSEEINQKSDDRNLPENKDYFQNQSFILSSNLKDSYGIGGATIELYEGNQLIISLPMPENTENKFSPQFEFTHDMLVEKNSSLNTGLHYLQPKIIAKDSAGNTVTEKLDYLAWEPEYDIPHVTYSTMEGDPNTNGKITVPVGGTIPITIFDDDGIKSVKYQYIKNSVFTNIESITTGWTSKTIETGLRDYSFDIAIPSNAEDGLYKLVVIVDDINSPSTTYKKAVDLKITNGDAATIIIESPQENSVPSLNKEGKFTISGYSIDNQDVDYFAVAWLPGENADIEKAEQFFTSYSFNNDATTQGTTAQQIQIKKLGKKSAENYGSGKKKSSFSITYDFFEDFKINNTVTNNTKVFMFACKDKTDNITTKTFRLNKFTIKPSFKVEYKYDSDANWTLETAPLITCKLKKTYFKITPMAENNMPIAKCDVELTNNVTGCANLKNWKDNGYYEFELSNGAGGPPASGQQFNLSLYAKDKLGGETINNLTIAFDEVGTLDSIDVNYVGGENAVPLTASDTLRFQANFTNTVSLDITEVKKPYIQLSATIFKYKDGTQVQESDRRAYYVSGNNSNTLYFEYKIPDNIELEATNLTIPVTEPINLNGLTANEVQGVFTKTNVGKTFNDKKLCLDSIAPYIITYSPEKNGIKDSTVVGGVRSVEIKLTFNEPVEIESGTLVLQRTKDWYIPPVISEDVFLKMFNSTTAVNNKALRKTLCGSETNVRTETSKDRLNIETMLPDGPYMQYTQGLNLSGTNAVPDISTKYVLKYNYNIADTSGTVANLRSALETFGYHKAEFDIQSMTKSPDGKTLTLKVTDSDFIDCLKNGVEYSLTLTSECIHDKAYNYMAESKETTGYSIGKDEYKFYIGPVATPVIRVNRKATNAVDDKPTGKTDIKIDCETPGVTINWGQQSNVLDGSTQNSNNKTHTNTNDLSVTEVKNIITSKTINSVNGTTEVKNAVGDGDMTKASKTYIKAIASKTSWTSSDAGYEGAFKTMLHYNKLKKNNNTDEFFVFGAQNPEGASYTSGWPLTQNVNSSRECYQIGYRDGDHRYWESWQILTDFMMQTNANSGTFQDPAEPGCSYGQYIYGENVAYY